MRLLKKGYHSLVSRFFPPIQFSRQFPSFEAALAHCSGYDSGAILDRVLAATLEVVNGRAEYERDSVLFDRIAYSEAVLAGIALAVSRFSANIAVLDFGGSLGSSYFQNRKILGYLNNVDWCVVEQPGFVRAGRRYLNDAGLKFFSSLDELPAFSPDLLILSGVLQYLPDPIGILSSCLSLDPAVVVIDRTSYTKHPVSSGSVRIQNVRSSIYKASYPCHFFSEPLIVGTVCRSGYSLVDRFSCPDKLSSFAEWKGHVFVRAEV